MKVQLENSQFVGLLVCMQLVFCLLTLCEETSGTNPMRRASSERDEDEDLETVVQKNINQTTIEISRFAPNKREQEFLFRVFEPMMPFNLSTYRLPVYKANLPYHASHVYCARCKKRRPSVLPPNLPFNPLMYPVPSDDQGFHYIKGKVEKNFRVEIIKEEILNKLGLAERPTFRRNAPPLTFDQLPPPIKDDYRDFVRSDRDAYDYKPLQTIVFMESDPSCKPIDSAGMMTFINKKRDYVREDMKCFSFRISSKIKLETVTSIKLWFYVNNRDYRNGTGFNFHVIDIGNHKFQTIGNYNTFEPKNDPPLLSEGWLAIDTKLEYYIDLYKNQRIHGDPDDEIIIRLALITTPKYCNRCAMNNMPDFSFGKINKPFMAIKHGQPHPSSTRTRVKRSQLGSNRDNRPRSNTCNRNAKECCRKRFFVAFEDIGWHDWIIEPDGYQPNYCSGSCEKFIVPRYEHTSVIRAVYHYYPDLVHELMPCCAPSQMSSISMLYFDNEGNIHKTELKNMIIESCGCS